MNRTTPNTLTVLVLCPLCGLRKTVDSFIDPFTCTLVSHCRECRYQRAQQAQQAQQAQRECWGVL